MENELKPLKYFEDKYYVREDLYPEPFIDGVKRTPTVQYLNNMFKIGNCFDTKQIALDKCNAIRLLLNVKLIGNQLK